VPNRLCLADHRVFPLLMLHENQSTRAPGIQQQAIALWNSLATN
jgi:L-ribulose-5-phosphate 3-epimerase UlaE